MRSDHQQKRPTWDLYLPTADHRDLQAACAVLDVAPNGPVRRDAARWLTYCTVEGHAVDGVFHPRPVLDWQGWVADVDTRGRGWSHVEGRLFTVAAGLATDRPFAIPGVLDNLAEWTGPVWRILTAWGSGAPIPTSHLA